MKKRKTYTVKGKCGGIASVLQVDAATAERFVLEVQEIFPGRDSSVKAITAYLRTHHWGPGELSPVKVAAALRAVAYGLPEPSRSDRRVRGEVGLYEEFEPSAPPGAHHDAREATANLSKCPHGILMIRPCAICNRGDTTPYD